MYKEENKSLDALQHSAHDAKNCPWPIYEACECNEVWFIEFWCSKCSSL